MTSAILSPTDGNLLAVDTSTVTGSLALGAFRNGHFKIVGQVDWQKKAMHSEVATLELHRLLKQSQMTLQNLSCFAVNVGPGSFTGLRVGINLIRTLAYSLSKPIAPFNSLEVLAFLNAQDGETVVTAIKAVQNFFYVGVFKKQDGRISTLVAPHSSTLEEASALAKGKRAIIEGQTSIIHWPGAKTLVEMSTLTTFFPWNHIKPLYIRGSEAEEKLKKGLLKPLL